MARPSLSQTSGTRRIDMKISEEEVAAVEEWRRQNGVQSWSAAARQLMKIGIEATPASAE